MICKECGKEVKQINYKHLKKCCGLTPLEYKNKWKVDLYDEDIKYRCGKKGKDNNNYKNGLYCDDLYCPICGKKIKSKGKIRICRSCASKGVNNGFYHKKHSEETKKQLKLHSARKNKIGTFTDKKHSEETIIKQKNKRKNWWKKIDKKERYKHLRNFIIAGNKNNNKNKNTRIEIKIKEFLEKNNIKFKQNIFINKYNVDFYLIDYNIIIECFGDYWHCNPNIYSENYYNKRLKMYSKEKHLKDIKRIEELEKLNLKLYYFWETDILYNFNIVENKIKDILCLNIKMD